MGAFLQLQLGVFLAALLFFMQGALALECHGCVDLGDGSCSQTKMKKVKCPASSQVCVEMAATVKWSHGNFSVGEKGCGMGMSGTNDIALDLHGITAYYKLHQCNSSHCNTKVDLEDLTLRSFDNKNKTENGVECYGCFGGDCTNATIVKCYDSLMGCFHGNFTIKAGNFSLVRPIKGCVRDEECTRVTKGSQPVTLTGSCCSGNLCNVDLSNKTFFAHNIPPLKVLPEQDTNSTTVTTTPGHAHTSLPAPSTSSKSTRSVTVTPSVPKHHDHDHDHDHDHNHDHDHDHNHTEILSARDRTFTAVKVEERHHQQAQVPYNSKGNMESLGWAVFMVLLLSGLLL